jgi:hypothetical protein
VKRLLVLLVACGGAQKPAGDAHWIEGRFHSAQRDAYWQTVDGVLWGVALTAQGNFEVNHVDGTPRALVSFENGANPLRFPAQRADGEHIAFAGVAGRVHFDRTANGFHGDYLQPDGPTGSFEVVRADLPRVPAIEQADLELAADTAKEGADGWARHFDEHGAMWGRDHRIEGAAIHETIAKTFAAGTLTWRPVTSGARGDLGFSLGTAEFTPRGGAPEHETYCTIWKHEADGSWKVLFDIGRPAV